MISQPKIGNKNRRLQQLTKRQIVCNLILKLYQLLLLKLTGLFDVNEYIGNSVIFKERDNMQTEISLKDPKTNGQPLNTFINLCKFFPEWMLKVHK